MCLTCGKHVTESLWYLEPERHRIRSLGLFRDIAARHMHPIIMTGLRTTKKKQPYGSDDQFNIVSKTLLNWLTRTFHGVQVLPNLESAFQMIDMANELALLPCLCKQIIAPNEPPEWKCIGLNIAAQVYFRKGTRYPARSIDKQTAKEITAKWRERGAFQSAGWLWDANVVWICNCHEYCVSHRSTEVEWGAIPSLVAAAVVQREKCEGCQECASWCRRDGALTFDADGCAAIDESLCRGCGLCVEHCRTGALGYVPRKRYFDVSNKTVREIEGGIIRL